ncbi:chitin deacetylase [Cladochytrium tenue]|nr:chitin deacetylase [Cladochytrium tenue]
MAPLTHLSALAATATAVLIAVAADPALAYDFSWAPPLDKVAPINTAWTAAFLGTGSTGAAQRASLADVLAQVAPLASSASSSGETAGNGRAVDRAAARVLVAPRLSGRAAAGALARRGTAGFAGNDVSEASGYTDWKYCDDGLPSNAWGLSYDDGPSEYTPGVLDWVWTTFFAIGSRVYENPDVLLSAYEKGHQIGIHTWSHPYLTQLTNDQIVAEIVYSAMAIKEVTGIVPKYMRPPYGDLDDRVRGVLQAMGVRVVTWATDSTDSADGATAASIAAVVAQWGGSDYDRAISLEHDLLDVEAAAIAPTLDSLLSFGRSPRPIADCIGYGMGDAYAASPLQQFFDDGYFDGNVQTPVSSAASQTQSSSQTSSSSAAPSTVSLGGNKGGSGNSTAAATGTATGGASSTSAPLSGSSMLNGTQSGAAMTRVPASLRDAGLVSMMATVLVVAGHLLV